MGRYRNSDLYWTAYNKHYGPPPETVMPASFPRIRANYNKIQLIQIAWQAAARHGYNPTLFVAQIWNESGFRTNAISRDRRGRPIAYGVAQIIPSTAKAWGVNPMNPPEALNAAAKAMASYYKTYKNKGYNDIEAQKLAMAAYNAGPGNVKKYGGVPPFKETIHYIARIVRDRKLFRR